MCSEDVTGQGGRPVSGFQADIEACFGIDVTAGGKIYRTYNKKLKKTDTCSCGALV